MLGVDHLTKRRMLVGVRPAAYIGLAFKHGHALPCLRQRSRGRQPSRARSYDDHVVMLRCIHSATRWRSAISTPCAKISIFFDAGTLTRAEKTS